MAKTVERETVQRAVIKTPSLFDVCDYTPPNKHATALRERFGVPPFSVLDTKAGDWQARKRNWVGLGIQS